MCSKEVKLLILNEIGEHKDILFGCDAGRYMKATIWQNIFHKAWLQGAYQNKTWKYIRDATWPSIKKCALTKLKKSKKKHRNFNSEMTDIDKKVLEIMSTTVIKDEPNYTEDEQSLDMDQDTTKKNIQDSNITPNSADESTVSSSNLLKEVGESKPKNGLLLKPNISQMKGIKPKLPISKSIIKKERRYNYYNRRPIMIHDEAEPSTSNFIDESNISAIDETAEVSQLKEENVINTDVTSYSELKKVKRSKHNKMAQLKCEKLKLEIEILKENKLMCEIGIENKRIEKKILSLQLIKLENELGIHMSPTEE